MSFSSNKGLSYKENAEFIEFLCEFENKFDFTNNVYFKSYKGFNEF